MRYDLWKHKKHMPVRDQMTPEGDEAYGKQHKAPNQAAITARRPLAMGGAGAKQNPWALPPITKQGAVAARGANPWAR